MQNCPAGAPLCFSFLFESDSWIPSSITFAALDWMHGNFGGREAV
jgi:hypothetical protein